MLFRLEIENFYSIRDHQEIDLRLSGKVRQKPERFAPIFHGASERVPKVVVFFGANGAGKTNCLRALSFLAWFVTDSFQLQPEAPLPLAAFGDKESLNGKTRLAVWLGGPTDLLADDSSATGFGTYEYELVIDRSSQTNNVHRESLRHRAQNSRRSIRVFERNESGAVSGGEHFSLSRYGAVIDKIRQNASVISTLAQFDHGPSVALRKIAQSVFTNIFIVKQDYTDDQLLSAMVSNPQLLGALNREIPRVDLGISDIQVIPGNLSPIVQFVHQGLDMPVPWALESHGTQSFVRSFPLVAPALQTGGLAVIDELDSSLHPIMLGEMIRWFYDPVRNPFDAMLWFTCQNASLLEELEKEEVVFCEKDNFGRTALYGLQDIKNVRRVDNYYRKYLSGVYGALPALG